MGEHSRVRMSRRAFLRYGGSAALVVALPAALQACGGSKIKIEGTRRTFSESEARSVEAVLERLIPSDDAGPGAKEAKVWQYIDRSLAGPDKALAPMYRANLKALDAASRQQHDKAFVDLEGAQQDALLTTLEKGSAHGFAPDASTFFATFREHALQGMFGDPYHGGNQDFVGWKLISFPGIRLMVPAEQQRLDVKVPLQSKSVAEYTMFKLDRAA